MSQVAAPHVRTGTVAFARQRRATLRVAMQIVCWGSLSIVSAVAVHSHAQDVGATSESRNLVVDHSEDCFCLLRADVFLGEVVAEPAGGQELFLSTFTFVCEAGTFMVNLTPVAQDGYLEGQWRDLGQARVGLRSWGRDANCAGEFFLVGEDGNEVSAHVTNLEQPWGEASAPYVLESSLQNDRYLRATLYCVCMPE
jgi:hypothetical protein